MNRKPMQRVVNPEDVKWRWVAAVVPYYYAGGRTACRVHYVDGKTESVLASSERLLERWLGYYGTTSKVMQERAEKLLAGEQQRRLPLVVNRDVCLVPLKCRELEGRNTGTLGYFNLNTIYYVIDLEEYGSMVFLFDGHKGIRIPQKKSTVEIQMRRGETCIARYVEMMEEQNRQEEELRAKHSPYAGKYHMPHSNGKPDEDDWYEES